MNERDTNDEIVLLVETGIAVELARVAMLKLAKGACLGSEGARDALAEGTGWLQKVAKLADAVDPGQEQNLSGAGLSAHAATIEDQIDNLRACKFLTNSILKIRGSLAGERSLEIFGLSQISLTKRQWLVLKHLALHAQANPGSYLSVSEIVNALKEDPTRDMAEFWKDVAPEDVHKIIWGLRQEIEEAGGNPCLIESAESYAAGYRLSTPGPNVFLEDLDTE